MSKPLQFSMRRMIIAVTFFCMASLLFSLGSRSRAENYQDATALVIAPALAGVGIGTFFRKPLLGAIVVGVLLSLPMLFLVYITWGVCP